MRRIVWSAFWVFLLDQATKYYVVHWLDLRNQLVAEVWPPFLTFRMAWNEGVNFGLFETSRWLLIAVALIISVWVFVWVRKSENHPLAEISAGMLIGGALGNVIDRVLYGAVADFLNVSCCGFTNPYAFNVADIAVFAGAAGLVLFTGEKNKTP
ncbi:signal peptidase II [Cochlodiniinecator piscidefendens]|uniref:signal peptidase II n=1 Tax=Cochlodiniinecator piscidefendens TaxID=2715756 RepID=UPI00140D4730|nr:signal peptidase II [Cochlodiniinecator piscidefendens]